MLQTTPVMRRDVMILLFVLVVAVFMRFYRSDVVEYFHDDAMLSTMAQEMVTGVNFPLTGILSSTGIPNPPISVYVMAIPFAISLDPQLAIYFVMALNVVGVGLLWTIAHRYFGRTVGLWAGLFYAVSPWAVYYSRKIWAQDFHTPFILLALLLGLYGFCEEKPRRWAQILCLPILLFGIQIHFAAWAFLPLYIIMLWMGRKNIKWWALLGSGVLTAIVLLPYAIGLAQTLQVDPTRVSDVITREDSNSDVGFRYDVDLISVFFAYTVDARLQEFVLDCLPHWMDAGFPDCSVRQSATNLTDNWNFIWLKGIAVVMGTVSLGWFLIQPLFFGKRKTQPTALFNVRRLTWWLLVWILTPFIILMPQWTGVYAHYFIATLPAFALLGAIGIGWGVELLQSRKIPAVFAWIGFVSVLFGQFGYMSTLIHFFDTNDLSYPYFTTPLHYLKTIENELHSYQDVVVVSRGMAWNLNHEVVVWDTLLKGDVGCVRTLKDGYFVQPSHPFAILIAPDGRGQEIEDFYKTSSEQIFNMRPALGDLMFPTDEVRYYNPYTVYSHDFAPEWTKTPLKSIESATFDNGVQLIGYDVKNGWLVLQWHITRQAPRGEDYQYSAQFFNVNGERIGQQDNRFWQGMHWCADDTLITYTPFEMPANVTEMRVSMYRLGNREGEFFNANLLDGAGNPAGQQVVIQFSTP